MFFMLFLQKKILQIRYVDMLDKKNKELLRLLQEQGSLRLQIIHVQNRVASGKPNERSRSKELSRWHHSISSKDAPSAPKSKPNTPGFSEQQPTMSATMTSV
ncbi:hypothetical protein [Pseudomonas khavaziana]|uniref:hypothetical protein n=1 Tax=Pseudomonas khavaziana TaxID=2842351 RepID=UPI001C3D7DD1|nr:hypothetical protein [Pseudomonas khavaziana]MBV4482629.1 hypothetical protein [Pseudomonas khavaziana]